ncbi:MAG TPA: hypothetical protein VJR06_07870, partial [Nitrososphaerales archaeon]|nr:hypothetical protein [Nitrososphaerales archaeon]
MSLGVTSGVVTQASGWAPTGRTLNLEPLPVHIIGSGDQSPVNSFAGPDGNRALNVNISGGSIAVNISGQPVSVSGQPVIALSGGVLPVSLVSGTITVLSGVTVVISGVTAEISGDVVNISGQTVQIVSGAVGFYQPSPATLASGATTPLLVDSIGRPAVRIDTFTVMAPVDIQAKLSGIYIVSGEAVYVSTSGATVAVASGGTLPVTGGVVVSGSVQVSGTVAVSNTGFQVSGAVAVSGTVGVSNFPAGFVVSGGITVSGGVTVSGVVGISGGAAGLSGLIVEISGQAVTTTVNPFGYQSGTLVGVSGGQLALSGLNVVFSGQAVSVSGDTLVVATSGYITLDVVYQNSGTAGSGLLGVAPMGLQGTQFFPLTANSGSLNVNISGGSI